MLFAVIFLKFRTKFHVDLISFHADIYVQYSASHNFHKNTAPVLGIWKHYLVNDRFDGSSVQYPLYLLTVEVGQTNALRKTQLHTLLHSLPCVHIVHVAGN